LPVEEDAYRKSINGARAFTALRKVDEYIRHEAFCNPENTKLQQLKQEFYDIIREQQVSWLVIK
jgi:hypothetical protein